MSESLITLCHLNPLSAELLPGSGSLGGLAHTRAVFGVSDSRSEMNTQACNNYSYCKIKFYVLENRRNRHSWMGVHGHVMRLIGPVKVRTQTTRDFKMFALISEVHT